MNRRERARAIAGFVPDCVVLFSRLVRDGRLPRRARLVLAALAAYLAFPLDLVPDFLPVVGQLDDALIVGLALRAVVRGGGAELVREHWPGPRESLEVVLRVTGAERPASPRASCSAASASFGRRTRRQRSQPRARRRARPHAEAG